MPAFKRKAYYEQLIPEKNSLKGNRAIRLQLQSGLGLDVVGKIRAMCSYLLGASSADSASEGERTQVVIDAGRCTVYAKSEKTWKQLELEEIEEKERERERKMVELRGMMTGMSEEVSQVKEMMVNKFGEGEEKDVGGVRATEGGSLEEALRGGREKKGKRAKFMKFMAGK